MRVGLLAVPPGGALASRRARPAADVTLAPKHPGVKAESRRAIPGSVDRAVFSYLEGSRTSLGESVLAVRGRNLGSAV